MSELQALREENARLKKENKSLKSKLELSEAMNELYSTAAELREEGEKFKECLKNGEFFKNSETRKPSFMETLKAKFNFK